MRRCYAARVVVSIAGHGDLGPFTWAVYVSRVNSLKALAATGIFVYCAIYAMTLGQSAELQGKASSFFAVAAGEVRPTNRLIGL